MADYTGNRRSHEPFAEDDAMPTCPKCGAGVRPGQEWCTLCLHVLRAPEPVVVVAPQPAPHAPDAGELTGPTGPTEPTGPTGLTTARSNPVTMVGGVAQVATAPPVPREQVEAAAAALLAQLAVESRGQRLTVPSFLDSNVKIGVAVTAAIAAICFVVVVGLTIVGAVLR